jgi:hypothetical protein
MGIICSIIGKQGSGKTRSIKTIKNLDELIVLRPSRKPFSFRNKLTEWNKETGTGQFFYADESAVICGALKKFYEKGKRIFVLEDSTFIMTNYFMETAMEKGYDKFSLNAKNYFDVIKAAESLPDDARIYMMNHEELDQNGELKFKTIGKMLDEKVDIGSLLTIVLRANVVDGKHTFQTNKVGTADISKSPEEMFDDIFIENDLQLVDDRIKWYYNIDQNDSKK